MVVINEIILPNVRAKTKQLRNCIKHVYSFSLDEVLIISPNVS